MGNDDADVGGLVCFGDMAVAVDVAGLGGGGCEAIAPV